MYKACIVHFMAAKEPYTTGASLKIMGHDATAWVFSHLKLRCIVEMGSTKKTSNGSHVHCVPSHRLYVLLETSNWASDRSANKGEPARN